MPSSSESQNDESENHMCTLFAALFASGHLIINLYLPSSKYFVEHLYLTASSIISPIIFALSIPNAVHHKQEYHDLPSGIPPPETEAPTSLCVDTNGKFNFTKVQAAVDAVPQNSQTRTVILIKKGTYIEKVTIPSTKPSITFQGEGYLSTVISWNDTAKSSGGTAKSYSVHVGGANFIAKNISFKPYGLQKAVEGAQALAVSVTGDKSAFWGRGFYGFQDTLNAQLGGHYFRDCYIEGTVDFIFGYSRSFYENCQLVSVADAKSDAYVTAHGRKRNDDSGYAFVRCTVKGDGRLRLARDWGPYARVVFAYTSMPKTITPQGWVARNPKTVFFGEFSCSGPGANAAKRGAFVCKLDQNEANPFLTVSFIDGNQWLQPFNA